MSELTAGDMLGSNLLLPAIGSSTRRWASKMKRRWMIVVVHGLALASGAWLALSGVSSRAFLGASVLAFLLLVAVGFIAAWRRGHSGIAIIPVRDGPFGVARTLSAVRQPELFFAAVLASFIVGLGGGLVWVASSY